MLTPLLGSDGPCQHYLAPAAGPMPPASGQLKHPPSRPFDAELSVTALGTMPVHPAPQSGTGVWRCCSWWPVGRWEHLDVGPSTCWAGMKKLLSSRALKGLQGLGQVWAPQGGRLKVRGQSGAPAPDGLSPGPGSEAPECGQVSGVGAVLTSQWRGPLSLASPPVAGSCCPAAGHVPPQQL